MFESFNNFLCLFYIAFYLKNIEMLKDVRSSRKLSYFLQLYSDIFFNNEIVASDHIVDSHAACK